jgi:alkylhydroperoxidase family enzyme
LLGEDTVRRALADFRTAGLDAPLVAILGFIEKLSLSPELLGVGDIHALRAVGLADEDIDAATQVAAVFHTINRVAHALQFEPQSDRSLARSTTVLIKAGYRL